MVKATKVLRRCEVVVVVAVDVVNDDTNTGSLLDSDGSSRNLWETFERTAVPS